MVSQHEKMLLFIQTFGNSQHQSALGMDSTRTEHLQQILTCLFVFLYD